MLRRYPWLLGIVLALAVSARGQKSYSEAGAPPPDRVWSAADYKAFANLLGGGVIKLPTLGEPESAALFARLVNPANLERYRSPATPVRVRLQALTQMTKSWKEILLVYTRAERDGRKLSREIASAMGMLVRVSSLSLAPTMEIFSAIPPTAPDRAKRLEALETMKASLVEVFLGTEASLDERSFYSPLDLAVLVAALAESLPAFMPALSARQRLELLDRLKKRKSEFTEQASLAHLDAMIETLLRAPAGP